MTKHDVDVIVAGGGPAGASAAITLRQRGRSVLLFEQEPFPRFHVGESLLPALWELWDSLEVTAQIEALDFPVKQGVNFALFDQTDIELRTGEYPEYFPRPYTYHVDRASFDEVLLDQAKAKGTDVREGWTVRDVLMEGQRAVGVLAEPPDGPAQTFHAPVVVDATGRSCLLARKLGWRKPDPALNKLSYFTQFRGAARHVTDGSVMTDIHSIDGGWIWYIPLKDDLVSVGAVLDTQHVRSSGIKGVQERFDHAIASSPRIREWIGSSPQTMEMQTVSNISYLNDSFVGDGFVLVGDASMFIDPIFSAGVTLAIRGGIFAAEAIDAAFDAGDFTAERFRDYERSIRHPMDRIFKLIYNWYDILKRKDANNIFVRSRRIPLLRERLVVLLSGGYDRADLESFLAEEGAANE